MITMPSQKQLSRDPIYIASEHSSIKSTHQERRSNYERMYAILLHLARQSGAEYLLLADNSGHELFSWRRFEHLAIDGSQVAALAAAEMLASAAINAALGGSRGCGMLVKSYEQSTVLINPISSRWLIIVMLPVEAQLGYARLGIQRAHLELESLLPQLIEEAPLDVALVEQLSALIHTNWGELPA